MRKIKSLLPVILVLSFVLAGCSAGSPKATITPPDKVVQGFLDALKASKFEDLPKYVIPEGDVHIDDTFSSLDDDDDDGVGVETIKAIYGKMSYKLGEVTADEDTASVPVDVTAIDMKIVFGTAMAKALEEGLANLFNEDFTQEDTQRIFDDTLNEGLQNPEAETVTTSITIPLKKANDKWLIVFDEAFGADISNAITGGLVDALTELGEAFDMED